MLIAVVTYTAVVSDSSGFKSCLHELCDLVEITLNALSFDFYISRLGQLGQHPPPSPFSMFIFQRKTAAANWKPMYSSIPILFNLEMTY